MEEELTSATASLSLISDTASLTSDTAPMALTSAASSRSLAVPLPLMGVTSMSLTSATASLTSPPALMSLVVPLPPMRLPRPNPPPPLGMHMPRLDLPPPAKKKPATPEETIAYKEGLRSKAQKLVFDPQKDGDVREWKGFTPSKCTVQDGIRQVRVNKPGLTSVETARVDPEMLAKLDKEFADIVSTDKAKVTTELFAQLADRYGFKTGKWFVMEKWQYVDALFQGLVEALLEGKLPASVLFVKITGRDDSEANPHGDGTCKLSVVTSDFTNEEAVMAVSDSLHSLNFRRLLRYKADIYSYLKIFAGNEFGIIPTMYYSTSWKAGESGQRGGRGRRSGRGRGGPRQRGDRGGFGRGRGQGGAPAEANGAGDAEGGGALQRPQRTRFGSQGKGREGRAMECANWRKKNDDEDGDK